MDPDRETNDPPIGAPAAVRGLAAVLMAMGAVAAAVSVAAARVVDGPLTPSAAVHPAASPAASATQAVPEPPRPSPDSAAAVREARDAQARFERRRLRWVGIDRSGPWGSGCDEVVGRLCLHLEEGGDWWPGEHDAPELNAALATLLRELESAAGRAPGDPWILGQRVVYLGEAGRWPEAEALARRCGVREPGWCEALLGLTLHAQGDYPAAEEAFARALAAMPPERAAAWSDIEPLLDEEGRDHLDDLDDLGEGAVAGAVRRFWRYSDPLFLVPGNDRYTEHLARRVVARTRSEARNPYSMRWGDDLDELLVRYGWEVGWERVESGPGALTSQSGAIGHHHPYTRGFVSPGSGWRDPTSTSWEDWNPGSRARARAGYAPAYAPVFLPGPGQITVLPRGDRMAVLATVTLPDDTTYHGRHDHEPLPIPARFEGDGAREGLFLVSESGDSVVGVTRPAGSTRPLLVEVPAGTWLASLEAWSPEEGRAGRIRRAVVSPATPPDLARLSDIMLAEAGPEPAGASDVAARLLASTVLHPGDTVRVAWEVYGLGWREESFRYRLRMREDGGGFLHSAGRFLGLVGDPREIALDWTEAGPAEPGPALRSIVLALPPDLEPARYEIQIELRSVGRETLVSNREIEVVPRR